MANTSTHTEVLAWVEKYEHAWRTAGTAELDEVFTDDATYRMAPFEEPHRGLEAIRSLWEKERSGPDEPFEMDVELVAVEPPRAVLRLEVRYGAPTHERFRDLWILELTPEGRCRTFEEWPFLATGASRPRTPLPE